MNAQYPMYEITEADEDLAREFRGNPNGPHRPDVLRLVNRILWTPVEGRVVLVCTRSHREWRLARLSGVRGQPIEILEGCAYTERGQAIWAVFKMRWESITGKPLEI